jgi:hypothetical protein
VDLRHPPATDALVEQKLFSMSHHQQWWLEKLEDGRLLPEHHEWEREVLRDELRDDYIAYVGPVGTGARSIATRLGLQLRELLPRPYPRSRQQIVACSPAGNEVRRRYWCLPSLEECRSYFDRITNTRHQWETK